MCAKFGRCRSSKVDVPAHLKFCDIAIYKYIYILPDISCFCRKMLISGSKSSIKKPKCRSYQALSNEPTRAVLRILKKILFAVRNFAVFDHFHANREIVITTAFPGKAMFTKVVEHKICYILVYIWSPKTFFLIVKQPI